MLDRDELEITAQRSPIKRNVPSENSVSFCFVGFDRQFLNPATR